VKKVVDINYLQEPDLKDYLAKNKESKVVFTDIACMEIYKYNALKNLVCKLEIVSQFPDQVIVLKGMREIISLTLDPNVLPQGLIDNDQTNGFPKFCKLIKSACEGNILLSREVSAKQSLASQYFENLKQSHQLLVDGMKGTVKSYSTSHLKILRTGKKIPQDLMNRITKDILWLTALLLQKHPDIRKLPEFNSLQKSYVFRYTVSNFLLFLRWIIDGGIDQVSYEKLRNDVIDMSYITYATYFDGLLSSDKKLNEIYTDTLIYLRYFNNH
jgi:hypothetical protein